MHCVTPTRTRRVDQMHYCCLLVADTSIELHCTALHCTVLHCTALNWIALQCTVVGFCWTLHSTGHRYIEANFWAAPSNSFCHSWYFQVPKYKFSAFCIMFCFFTVESLDCDKSTIVINRAGVAGAVLQTPLVLIHSLNNWVVLRRNIFKTLALLNR